MTPEHDNPLDFDSIDGHEPKLLRAIAREGDRLHVLRQLDAGHDSREMDARDVALEEGMTPAASLDAVAETFVESYQLWFDEHEPDIKSSRCYRLEATYGERADRIMAEAGRDDEVRGA